MKPPHHPYSPPPVNTRMCWWFEGVCWIFTREPDPGVHRHPAPLQPPEHLVMDQCVCVVKLILGEGTLFINPHRIGTQTDLSLKVYFEHTHACCVTSRLFSWHTLGATGCWGVGPHEEPEEPTTTARLH